jgi:hypothetical protein
MEGYNMLTVKKNDRSDIAAGVFILDVVFFGFSYSYALSICSRKRWTPSSTTRLSGANEIEESSQALK